MKPVAAKTTAHKPPNNGPKSVPTEPIEELLFREVHDSRQSMRHTVRRMKSEAGSALRPSVVTRSHPWIMTGAAAATGFAVASAIASRFRKPPAKEPESRDSTFSPTAGAAAVGLAALVRLLQSPAGAAMPTMLGTLFSLWQSRRGKKSCPAASNKNGRRP